MGELSSWDASVKRNNYANTLNQMKTEIRKNFEDMDFENAKKRDEVEGLVAELEDTIQRRLSTLAGMGFE